MLEAERLFEDALDWLRATYDTHRFYLERDVVWTVQQRLTGQAAASRLPLRVFNDYPMVPAKNRSLSADLVLVGAQGSVDVAAEFKFEPAHSREDVLKQKLPVVFWGMDGVGKDIQRVGEYVERGRAKVAYSVFIDEGGAFPSSRSASWVELDRLGRRPMDPVLKGHQPCGLGIRPPLGGRGAAVTWRTTSPAGTVGMMSRLR